MYEKKLCMKAVLTLNFAVKISHSNLEKSDLHVMTLNYIKVLGIIHKYERPTTRICKLSISC